MTIQVNTDTHIDGSQNTKAYVTEKVEAGMKHYAEKITRIEVHLSDQNADKDGPEDIQCKIEARIEGQQPVLVESKDETMHKALSEAIDKMQAVMRTMIGKMQEKHPKRL
jgi:ribosomal subunit interface protein